MKSNGEIGMVLSISCFVLLPACTTTTNFSAHSAATLEEFKSIDSNCKYTATYRHCYDTTPTTKTTCTTDKYKTQNCTSVHHPSERSCSSTFDKEDYFSCMSKKGMERIGDNLAGCGVTKKCFKTSF